MVFKMNIIEKLDNITEFKNECFDIINEFTRKKVRFSAKEKLDAKQNYRKGKIQAKIQGKKDRKKVDYKKRQLKSKKMAKLNKTSTGKYLSSKAK